MSAAEMGVLLACGAVATIGVGAFQQMGIRLPGHAILRAVLPMAFGLALVPRRSAGMGMSVGAAVAAITMMWAGFGHFPPAALIGVLALGPVLDIALTGQSTGWRLYARFVVAGIVANLIAFVVRFSTAWLGWETSGSRQFMPFWSAALASFVVCGAVAGLVSAALWFRLRVGDDLRRA